MLRVVRIQQILIRHFLFNSFPCELKTAQKKISKWNDSQCQSMNIVLVLLKKCYHLPAENNCHKSICEWMNMLLAAQCSMLTLNFAWTASIINSLIIFFIQTSNQNLANHFFVVVDIFLNRIIGFSFELSPSYKSSIWLIERTVAYTEGPT